jgi:hypothetical protein
MKKFQAEQFINMFFDSSARRMAAGSALRSKTPVLVKQDLWFSAGALCYPERNASGGAEGFRDVDTLSFIHAARVIKPKITA